MTASMDLPPVVTVRPTMIGVCVFTAGGASVQIDLPRPGGLNLVPREELIAKATILARAALRSAETALKE